MPATISWLGQISNAGGSWTGAISSNLDEADSAEPKAKLAQSFVKVDDGAAMRCIDGRIGQVHKALGPQIAGGGPGFVLAFHFAKQEGSSVVEDFISLWQAHKDLGDRFAIGGHIDDHSKPPMSGCGAIDKMPQILAAMTAADNQPAIRTYVKAIAGEAYNSSSFNDVTTAISKIDQTKYFKEQGHSYRRELVKEISERSDKEAIEELSGAHKESFVIVNKQPNTTLDKELFVADNQDLTQAFNYDFWYVRQLAIRLFPGSVHQQEIFTITSIIYNVATAMVLTDGTQILGLRREN